MTTPARRPVVRGAHVRRARPVRRASAGLSPVRAGGALAMLLSAAAIYGVAASPAFGVDNVTIDGLRYTPRADVDARLAPATGANLFGLRTDRIEASLRQLPTVAAAHVSVALPDTLAVDVEEREPIVSWQVGDRRLLADRDGALFAQLGDPSAADASSLPVVVDRRVASSTLGVGATLDPIDLDAARRLASLRPSDVGSRADRLLVEVTDEHGFVVRPVPGGWSAVFGFYTQSLRTTDMVAGQVRLLRSLLVGQGEGKVAQIILASETEGTFSTPRPSGSRSPAP